VDRDQNIPFPDLSFMRFASYSGNAHTNQSPRNATAP
jgi:hypothetical protein